MNPAHDLPTATRFLVLLFLILAGASQISAQQPPANLTALADARPSSVYQPTDAPQPTLGPRFIRRPEENHHIFFVLGTAVYTAALLDMAETSSRLPNFHEYDPLARPLLKLPPPLYYTAGMSWATGINLVGWKMARAPRMRRFWWTAQAAAIMGHLTGFGYTRTH
jgi:hypothetical protein